MIEELPTFRDISAGIIQWSGIGPASYSINSSKLKVITPGNFMCKYAYLYHVSTRDVHPKYAKNGNGNGKSTCDNEHGNGYFFMCAKIPIDRLDANAI